MTWLVLVAGGLWVVAYYLGRADGLRAGRLRLLRLEAERHMAVRELARVRDALRDLERLARGKPRDDEDDADWWRTGRRPKWEQT